MIRKSLSTLILCLLVFTLPTFAQEEIKELQSGYYMTVAAYLSTGEGYAMRYTQKLKADGFNADYGFTYKKNMYFVYIKYYSDFTAAVNEINSTRKNTPFDDAWVYAYKAVKPIKETEVKEVAKVNEVEKVEEVEEAPADSTISVQDTATVIVKVKTITKEETTPTEEPDGSRIISFEALRARTQEPVDVEVTLFDPFFEKVITTMRSWESKRVSPPDNNQDIIRVRTNTIGWKTDAVSFNFNDPVNDSTDYFVKVSNDTLILFFDMHRLRKGDVQILFNVYFQSESSIMRPVSKLQLQELWDMMDENPKYRIRLHGHTNGNASGDYTRLGENDTIFFQTSSKHEQTSGSAKKLSYDRALTVKKYLVSRGIAADRMDIKAWGGKKQIYDKNSRAATRNIRVEVEVMEE
jgi:outer membrane protein OmpA-like peptidoglycan-associated protein